MQRSNLKICKQSLIDLGNRIRAERIKLNYTIKELEYISGVSFSSIANLEAKRASNVTLYTLIALNSALKDLKWQIPLIEEE